MFLPEVLEVLINTSVDLIEYCAIGLIVLFVALAIGALAGFGQ